MLASYKVTHRYTPPTCTLEIWAKQSRLSRYLAGHSSLQELKFQLSFDDPRTPEDEQVILKGNRTQLELLCEAVRNYVQAFLRQSPTSLLPGIGSAGLTAAALNSERIEGFNDAVTAPEKAESGSSTDVPAAPHLQQKGLLAHRLFLGSLAADLPREYIELSALQLFDLANVLEDYQIELDALQQLAPTQKNRRAATLAWAGTAAGIVLTLGLTTVILREYQQIASDPTNDSSAPQESESAQSDNIRQVPIVPTAPQETPVPSPTLPPPLATGDQLPPPPPVSLPKPPTVQVSPAQPSSPAAPSREGVSVTPNASAPPQEPQAPPPEAPTPQPASPNLSASTPDNPKLPNLPVLQPRQSVPQPASPDTLAARVPSADSSEGARQGTQSNDSVPNESAVSESGSEVAANRGVTGNSIPQVVEAKQYFEKQWQPPETLRQTLEYRLVLNQNGSIGRITPLGQASKIYLDRAGIPLLGESFVSPLAESQEKPQIRVVLNPNGTVQTFLEPVN